MTTRYTSQHVMVLLATILQSDSILTQAQQFVRPADLVHPQVGGTPLQRLIYETILQFYEEHKARPDLASIVAEARGLFGQAFAPNSAEYAQAEADLSYLVGYTALVLDKQADTMCKALIKHIYATCGQREAVVQIAAGLAQSDAAGITKYAQRLMELRSKDALLQGGRSVSSILRDSWENEPTAARVQLGVPFLDARLGGGQGPATGCSAAILGVQGGGKTTLGFQIGVGQALQRRHALLVLVEEGLSKSVLAKLKACATGIPYPVLEKHKGQLAQSCEETGVSLEHAKHNLELLSTYLHVLDLQANEGDMATIEAEIEALSQQGQKPELVYVDWAGFLAAQLLAKSQNANDSKTTYIKQIGDACTNLSARYNCFVIVGHQLHPEKAQRGPFVKVSTYDGEECRGFTASMKYVFALGPRCQKTQLQIFTIVKARDDKPDQQIVIRLDGARALIREEPSWEVKGNRFRQKGVADNLVPKA